MSPINIYYAFEKSKIWKIEHRPGVVKGNIKINVYIA